MSVEMGWRVDWGSGGGRSKADGTSREVHF